MIYSIWVILAVILLTALLIVVIVIINPSIKFPEKHSQNRSNRKKNINPSKKEVVPEDDKPGKVLVSDSTYEMLMKEKEKRR